MSAATSSGSLVLLLEVARELADGGRLARALQADHHDAGRALLGELEARVDRAHQLDQLVVAELDEVVLGADAADLLLRRRRCTLTMTPTAFSLHPLAEVLDDLEADVGLEQRRAHVLERLVDGRLVELGQALELLLGGAESLGECLEHRARNLACLSRRAKPSDRSRRRSSRVVGSFLVCFFVAKASAGGRATAPATRSASARGPARVRASASRSGNRSTRR